MIGLLLDMNRAWAPHVESISSSNHRVLGNLHVERACQRSLEGAPGNRRKWAESGANLSSSRVERAALDLGARLAETEGQQVRHDLATN